MRLKHVKGAEEYIAGSDQVVQDYKEHKGAWNEFFGNSNRIHIEIGMGKGQFLMEMAATHPDINYIGIERYSSVLIRAVQKKEEMDLINLTFILMDATEICEVFDEQEVDRIYLNFSDPWPKDRHSMRRLTSSRYLNIYKQILKKDGCIEFKTDNRGLFDYSLESASTAGWSVSEVTYDLHGSEYADKNVMTEYEEKFSAEGNPIMRAVFEQLNF